MWKVETTWGKIGRRSNTIYKVTSTSGDDDDELMLGDSGYPSQLFLLFLSSNWVHPCMHDYRSTRAVAYILIGLITNNV